MNRRSRTVLAGLALALSLPGSAHAEATQLAPDFDRAEGYSYCYRGALQVLPPGNDCSASAMMSVAGVVDLDLRASTPLNGRIPGPTQASGHGYASVDHTLPLVGTQEFRYTLEVHVTEAVTQSGSRFRGTDGVASAYVSAYASSDNGGGFGDYAFASSDVVDSRGWAPTSLTDETITLTMTMPVTPSDRRFATAVLDVSIGGYADAGSAISTSGVPRGWSSLRLKAEITSVTVERISE